MYIYIRSDKGIIVQVALCIPVTVFDKIQIKRYRSLGSLIIFTSNDRIYHFFEIVRFFPVYIYVCNNDNTKYEKLYKFQKKKSCYIIRGNCVSIHIIIDYVDLYANDVVGLIVRKREGGDCTSTTRFQNNYISYSQGVGYNNKGKPPRSML